MSHTLLARADSAAGLWTTPPHVPPGLGGRRKGQDPAVIFGGLGEVASAQAAADVSVDGAVGDPQSADRARVRGQCRGRTAPSACPTGKVLRNGGSSAPP